MVVLFAKFVYVASTCLTSDATESKNARAAVAFLAITVDERPIAFLLNSSN